VADNLEWWMNAQMRSASFLSTDLSLNHTVDDALLNLQSSKPFRIFEFAVQL